MPQSGSGGQDVPGNVSDKNSLRWSDPPAVNAAAADPSQTGNRPQDFDLKWFSDPLKMTDLIHSLLDVLPSTGPSGYLLDLVWIVSENQDPSRFVAPLLWGALRRAVEWHNASVLIVVVAEQAAERNGEQLLGKWSGFDPLVEELNAKVVSINEAAKNMDDVLSSEMVWRGGMETYNEADHAFRANGPPGLRLELIAKDKRTHGNWLNSTAATAAAGTNFLAPEKTSGKASTATSLSGLQLARNLTLVARCSLASVPTYLLTDFSFNLRISCPVSDDDENSSANLLNSKEMFGNASGVVARLSYCVSSSGGAAAASMYCKPKLSLEDWKKYVIHGNADERSGCFLTASEQCADKELSNIHILMVNDSESTDKICIVLDPSQGGVLKSSQVILDTLHCRKNHHHQQQQSEKEEMVVNRFDLGEKEGGGRSRRSSGRQQQRRRRRPDVPRIQAFIQRVQATVLTMLNEKDPGSQHLRSDKLEETLREIQARVLSRIDCMSSVRSGLERLDPSPPENNSGKWREDHDEDDETVWPERRLLQHVDYLNEQKRLRNTDHQTMKPSTVGEYVILEAREMLKLFNKDGMARFPEKCEQVKTRASRQTEVLSNLDDSPGQSIENKLRSDDHYGWPDVTCLKYHDLYYNVEYDESEKLDMERMKVQRIHVGVNETMSTCHAQNNANASSSNLVITKKATSVGGGAAANHKDASKRASESGGGGGANNGGAAAAALRRSPRKKASQAKVAPLVRQRSNAYASSIKSGGSSQHQGVKRAAGSAVLPSGGGGKSAPKSADEVFKKKLRIAVYDTLEKRGIDEKHALFRACFKKLYEICKMYAKDAPGSSASGGKSGNSMSTSQWLIKVAEQNADTVINLEKSLLS